MTDRYSI